MRNNPTGLVPLFLATVKSSRSGAGLVLAETWGCGLAVRMSGTRTTALATSCKIFWLWCCAGVRTSEVVIQFSCAGPS